MILTTTINYIYLTNKNMVKIPYLYLLNKNMTCYIKIWYFMYFI